MSWRYNSSDIGYQDKEWDDYNPSFGMLHSQKPPKGEWIMDNEEETFTIHGDSLQKWECDTCGIYLWVEDRDGMECPNCMEAKHEYIGTKYKDGE